MSNHPAHGRLELLVRTTAPGNILTIPVIAMIAYFGWTAVNETDWLFRSIGVVLLLVGALWAVVCLLRIHQRLELYEHTLLLYIAYPPRTPDITIPLDALAAVQVQQPQPLSYDFSFELASGETHTFTLADVRPHDIAALTEMLERLRARGVRVEQDAAAASRGTSAV